MQSYKKTEIISQDDQYLQKFRQNLPVYQFREQFIDIMNKSQILIVAGETGSGKTTQIPQYILESGQNNNQIIGITQPRRVAALTVSKRVAQEKQTRVGELVGYSIRFEEKVDKNLTKIKFMTDGMLLRECILDPQLSKYSHILIDEAHERSINSDILLGFIKTLVCKRKNLKIIIMSATIEVEKFQKFFNTQYQLIIHGRTFPIGIYYASQSVSDYVDATLSAILQIHLEEEQGDILAFLTGEEDISDVENLLNQKLPQIKNQKYNLQVFQLYAALPIEKQLKAFEKVEEGTRKVILSTNIAETSVTIDGIKFVIDCGLVKVRQYNAQKGLDSLLKDTISKSSANQRAGRAGRQSQGKCFRLYTQETFESLKEYQIPEILRSNLCHVCLQLKAIGIKNVPQFDFLDKPNVKNIQESLDVLVQIKALDDEFELTSLGHEIAELPLDPIYGSLLLLSLEPQFNCPSIVLSLLSVLTVENLFYFPKEQKNSLYKVMRRFQIGNSDQLTKSNVFQQYVLVKNKKSFLKENFLNKKSVLKAIQIRNQLQEYLESIIKRRKIQDKSYDFSIKNDIDSDIAIKLLHKGTGQFKIAHLDQKGHYNLKKNNEKAFIHPESICFYSKNKPECIVYNEVIITKKIYLRDVTEIPF